MPTEISVIIPCLNEINTIGRTISAASQELTEAGFDFEIIVVDNGSTDGSDVVAKSNKATVAYSGAYTIAEVRNKGVKMAKGRVLVFLDADIVVQSNWGKALRVVYKQLMNDDNMITGSPTCVPENIQPILHSWYKAIFEDKRDSHIGTGHMVVSRNAFEKIGGFDQSLVTNEDFYFCYEAKKIGFKIVLNPDMKVFHLKLPNTLIDFAKREIWHGMGDCKNWRGFLRSRVACFGVVFLLFNIMMLLSLVLYGPMFFPLLTIVILIAVGFNLVKFGFGNIIDFFYRSFISYVYLISRGLSLPISLFKKNKFYHWTHSNKSIKKD